MSLGHLKKQKKLITCPVKCEVYLTGVDEKCPWGHFSFIPMDQKF